MYSKSMIELMKNSDIFKELIENAETSQAVDFSFNRAIRDELNRVALNEHEIDILTLVDELAELIDEMHIRDSYFGV